MIEINGVVYANDPRPDIIRVEHVKPLEDYKLFLTFTNGKQKIYDVSQLLENGVYRQLKDMDLFSRAYVSCGTVLWNDNLDIDPDTLYANSISVDNTQIVI